MLIVYACDWDLFRFLKCRFSWVCSFIRSLFLFFLPLLFALHSPICVRCDSNHSSHPCAATFVDDVLGFGINFRNEKCVEADVLWCISGTLLLISNNWNRYEYFFFASFGLFDLLIFFPRCSIFVYSIFASIQLHICLKPRRKCTVSYNECDQAIFFNLLRKINKANGCECVHVCNL